MADMQAFRKHLRSKGKKPHVVDDLCARLVAFEAHLGSSSRTLAEAQEQDLMSYAAREAGSSTNNLRVLGLYYSFAGNQPLARAAASLREGAIAKGRARFKMSGFMGVDPEHMAALQTVGVVYVDQMVSAGRTPEARLALSRTTAIPLGSVEEYVKLADISRLGAIKTKRARLYVDAGMDTIDKIAALTPEAFRAAIVEYVERSGFDGIPTLPKEAVNLIQAAQSAERVVVW